MLWLLKQLGRARGGPGHRVRTANPSISLWRERRKKKLQNIYARCTSFHISCTPSHKPCNFRHGSPHFAYSRKRAFVRAGAVNDGQGNVEQAQINRQLASMVIPVVEHD